MRDPQGCDIGAYETNGRLDSDKDGIADEVDPQPFVFSSNFSDIQAFGFTSGNIVNRNGHTVVVTDGKTGDRGSMNGTYGPLTVRYHDSRSPSAGSRPGRSAGVRVAFRP